MNSDLPHDNMRKSEIFRVKLIWYKFKVKAYKSSSENSLKRKKSITIYASKFLNHWKSWNFSQTMYYKMFSHYIVRNYFKIMKWMIHFLQNSCFVWSSVIEKWNFPQVTYAKITQFFFFVASAFFSILTYNCLFPNKFFNIVIFIKIIRSG